MKYQGLTGKVILPEDPEYNWARQEYNLAVDKYPLAIVYCFDQQDVANAVVWSRKRKIPLRIRSGGHNYEGYSTGNGCLVIDTSCMNDIIVNSGDNTTAVQAGTRLLPLYQRLAEYGYTFPGGTCPTVAISGLVLGGGIGLSTRLLGLTADSLLEAEMINAEGELLTANSNGNAALFWALRGAGGGNFGVVTNYKFGLQKAEKITLIQLRWDHNVLARNKFIGIWQEWLPNLDRRMSSFSGIYKCGAWMNAFFYGLPAEAREILGPILAIQGISQEVIEYVPLLNAVERIGAMYAKRDAFQAPGRFVFCYFTKRQLDNLGAIMDRAPSETESSIRVYSLGGAVRDTGPKATAFPARNADYIMVITSSWEKKQEELLHRVWIKAGYDYIYQITKGSYVNFPYDRTPGYEAAYFQENLLSLQCIKQKYDPHNVFHFPQGIRLP